MRELVTIFWMLVLGSIALQAQMGNNNKSHFDMTGIGILGTESGLRINLDTDFTSINSNPISTFSIFSDSTAQLLFRVSESLDHHLNGDFTVNGQLKLSESLNVVNGLIVENNPLEINNAVVNHNSGWFNSLKGFTLLMDADNNGGGADLFVVKGSSGLPYFSAGANKIDLGIGNLSSRGDIEITLDSDNNSSNSKFIIQNGNGNNIVNIQENGNTYTRDHTVQLDLQVNGKTTLNSDFKLNNVDFDFDGLNLKSSSGGSQPKLLEIQGDLKVLGNIYFSGAVYDNIFGAGDPVLLTQHPQEETKMLAHSKVLSPDRMDIYQGNTITDSAGFAQVILPNYFEALGQEFKYQLTVIGKFANAIIKQKIKGNKFLVQTDQPFIEVSWQVTGNRIEKNKSMPIEFDKSDLEKLKKK